ncbi:hypothetical protein LJ737_03900 [Hymenobacter sp. 15J16-1T3B]|uniref:hypothetical protein n=1 Tax=Hymenobacter sp. 15J16-1T3B TaxID=2886941 RepID=UPI001D113C6B|nr:hypothetical protein [Hymenobacter sp. 15J16-1T3B]MCC3156365.1 hypothetical protein [Hymenobacter sp. 15J16-1T3B]
MLRNLLQKLRGEQPAPPPAGIREVLFGDLPADQWPRPGSDLDATEPWKWFVEAQQAVQRREPATAEQFLRRVLATAGLESRHYLQAWQALRALGQVPTPAEAKQVLGVVVEVGMQEGLDLVAAYADGSARYYNFSGAGVVWERPDDSLAAMIQDLLAAGQQVAAQIGPWAAPRPAAPTLGSVRINMLTPSGLHFGQAPFEALWQDALGGPVLAAAQQLMQALIAKAQPAQQG